MRVVVVGATGNVGTAVLGALAGSPEITSVVGIARRMPDRSAAPYAGAEWVTADIAVDAADDSAEDAIVTQLAEAFAGADAVVHLVWLIQPNHDRELMRRANVDGTRRVAQACVRAGVGHLVCASSWAAYSPVDDDVPRDESWSTGGIRSSHYSVDKAAQERVLDRLEASHPEVVVTRMRTALIFTADAGAEIGRYFLGPWVPRGLLRSGSLPLLPLPTGLRLQVLHAEDAGRAYLEVLLQRAGGAFNVAAEKVLWAADLARILDHGRYVEITPRLIRPLLHYAWRAHLIASDAGWLDMGMGVPVMDVSRVRRELGWSPRHDAESTLRDMVEGLAARRGMPSIPMRPHDRRFEGTPATADLATGATMTTTGIDRDLLGLYLSDHLTGATAGESRVHRMVGAYADTPLAPDLRRIAADISEERALLKDLIDELGLRRRPYRQALAWVAEHAGRLKLNERVLSTSPMTVVLEIELMRSAVMGKLGGWQTMAELAPDLGLDRERFESLARRAKEQAATLDGLHARARRTAFRAGARPV